MTVAPRHAMAGDPVSAPQVVASYAAYLYVRTQAIPVAKVTDDHAELGAFSRGELAAAVTAFLGQ